MQKEDNPSERYALITFLVEKLNTYQFFFIQIQVQYCIGLCANVAYEEKMPRSHLTSYKLKDVHSN